MQTLGQVAGDFAQGQGFGQVKPAKIFNGGDPTGLVTHVVWSSWGGTQATATGTAEYVGPNQSNYQGTEESATVVAFDLGSCGGKYMYQAVEWYFPQHKQAFNPNTYEDVHRQLRRHPLAAASLRLAVRKSADNSGICIFRATSNLDSTS